ncbi:Protein xylosyltransferase [Bertholletia excelsa]
MAETEKALHGFFSCGALTRKSLKKGAVTSASLFFIVLFASAVIATHWTDVYTYAGSSLQRAISFASRNPTVQPKITYSLNCSTGNNTPTCPPTYPRTYEAKGSMAETCPKYFRWIHEDLRPWSGQGITLDMAENAKKFADIRVVVVNGSLYVEKYRGVFQTRDVFTIWGILQLLRLYPGKLPDLDLMIQCGDRPSILKRDFMGENANKTPPLLHYCGDDDTLDIVFPDWSFWGWPEINIPPWNLLKKELEEGNRRINWTEREPYAYWKGNIHVSGIRKDLMRCNSNEREDWNARIYHLDWRNEIRKGFKSSKLADQCNYRYKIYVEGIAWSVSEKYILACDSMSLLIPPHYYDFFTRSLLPTIHYWPIKTDDKCKSIKYAVDWGNNHTQEAQKIGKAASRFIEEQLTMKHVYDYMFHLFNEYGKLLRYKPSVPQGAVRMCSETMACNSGGLEKEFKIGSMVKSPEDRAPCSLPPPYTHHEFQAFTERKANLTRQVEIWEESGKI